MNRLPLVRFTNAQIRHTLTAAPVIKDLTFEIGTRDAWIITGPLGAGKTTVLDAIRGDKSVAKESLSHPFLEKQVWPSEVFKILRSNVGISGNAAYYSERYHSRREEDSLTLEQWLSADLPEGTLPVDAEHRIQDVAEKLDLSQHLSSNTMNLSNGQMKRATIAKALLASPKVLLLDEPFVGLDPGARQNLLKVLGTLVATGPTKIVLALRPLDEIPGWATHMLWLKRDGTTRHAGPMTQNLLNQFQQEFKHAAMHDQRDLTAQFDASEAASGETLVELHGVNVSYWGKSVLQDVSWRIRAGEKWALKGSNGSGKTTLLAMILGDHPKVYANNIHLFGRRRGIGDGRSVFEVQAQMGHSSPELHRHYPRYRTARECIASAYGETFHPPRQMTNLQQSAVEEIMQYFDVQAHADTKMSDLSPALQRLMLLLRALVKKPRLLILDEPFAGMDEGMISCARRYIDQQLQSHQALIFVTHYEEEIPTSITHTLKLDQGQVVV